MMTVFMMTSWIILKSPHVTIKSLNHDTYLNWIFKRIFFFPNFKRRRVPAAIPLDSDNDRTGRVKFWIVRNADGTLLLAVKWLSWKSWGRYPSELLGTSLDWESERERKRERQSSQTASDLPSGKGTTSLPSLFCCSLSLSYSLNE